MISLGKTLLVTSVLTLACAVAHAAHNNSSTNDDYIIQQGYMLFIPNIESEGKSTLRLEAKKIAYSYENSFLPKISSKKVMYKSCQSKKKNELYELSAIFNDKLQLFLASFYDSKNFEVADKNTNNDLSVSSNVRIH